MTQRERHRFAYYEQRLNAAFAAGYRAECVGEGDLLLTSQSRTGQQPQPD